MKEAWWYHITWRSWRGSVVHSDGGPYPDRDSLLDAIARVEKQVNEECSGTVLRKRGWSAPAPVEEIERYQQIKI